jgi:hypothetical protein
MYKSCECIFKAFPILIVITVTIIKLLLYSKLHLNLINPKFVLRSTSVSVLPCSAAACPAACLASFLSFRSSVILVYQLVRITFGQSVMFSSIIIFGASVTILVYGFVRIACFFFVCSYLRSQCLFAKALSLAV